MINLRNICVCVLPRINPIKLCCYTYIPTLYNNNIKKIRFSEKSDYQTLKMY